MIVTDSVFRKIVREAIDNIPGKYAAHISNVAFIIENNPTMYQREKLQLIDGQTLYGLYEGVPLTKRASNYNLVLPDKITIFKDPICERSSTIEDVRRTVNKTIWHEVAHYFGLDHDAINSLEN